jgi:hypothetical protein
VRFAFVYWLVVKSAGSLFVIFASTGLAWAVLRGMKLPLLFLLAATVAYQGVLLLALTTEPRYLNGLYLYLVPFLIILWVAIRRHIRAPRQEQRTAVGGSSPPG